MSPMRQTVKLVPLVPGEYFKTILFDNKERTLRDLLDRAPYLSLDPIPESWMDVPLDQLIPTPMEAPPGCALYRPPGLVIAPEAHPVVEKNGERRKETPVGENPLVDVPPERPREPDDVPMDYLERVDERDAVRWAHAKDIAAAASFLRAGLSVLVVCDKLIVEHLWQDMAGKAQLRPRVLGVPREEEGGGDLMPRSIGQRQMSDLRTMINDLKEGDVLVISHLDLLVSGNDANLARESREMIELVYEQSHRMVLAFADRSMSIPEVLAERFAVRLLLRGLERTVTLDNGQERPIGKALITAEEVSHFQDYDPETLYKNVAGMNPVQLRHAIKWLKQYAIEKCAGGKIRAEDLPRTIQMFKAQTSANFEVPTVTFENIGGYDEVKKEMARAIQLMSGGAHRLPKELQHQLIPRGFIFHGPPGTGKTLFAKAIANKLNATVQVVSGPEINSMWFGESERNIRDLFAEARRNAPSVLVFDEFDAIAGQREGQGPDRGTRAGNAVVAQILTEMDGFRPDVPMLIVGTTNRLDIIDPALLRPSRFKAIAIGLPNQAARRSIAEIHARHYDVPCAPELLDVIAMATDGMSGDDIQSLFRDACVGLYVEDRPIVADAHRFGRLVGALLKAAEERQVAESEHRFGASRRPGQRPGPSGPMITLTPADTEVEDVTDDDNGDMT
jgi:transitional endoplasmic reticulum ATPase